MSVGLLWALALPGVLGEISAVSAPLLSNFMLPLSPPNHSYAFADAFPGLTFDQPVAVLTAPGDTERLFVVEQGGRVFAMTNLSSPDKTLYLDLTDRVHMQAEAGLLGLAFHPQYQSNGLVYVSYFGRREFPPLGLSGLNTLSRFQVDPGNPNWASPESEELMILQKDRSLLHNAGGLAFGPDGYLYVGLGDEADGSDPYGNSQVIDRDYFSGVLRIDVDGKPGSLPANPHAFSSGNYFIPPDNPFVDTVQFNGQFLNPDEVRTEFFAVGLRNPWRFTFDSLTGDFYINDVGQLTREEINIGLKGGNYGWVAFEGTQPHVPHSSGFSSNRFSLGPLTDYGREFGNAVTASLLYRGHAYPNLEGAYLFADFGSGQIGALRYAESALAGELAALQQDLQAAEAAYRSARADETFLMDLESWKASQPSGWRLLQPQSLTSSAGSEFVPMEDLSYLMQGTNPNVDIYEMISEVPATNLIGARLELVPDDSFPLRGPGRVGNFVLSEFRVFVAPPAAPTSWSPVALVEGQVSYDLNQGFPIENTWDGNHGTGWALGYHYYGKSHFANFRFAEPVALEAGSRIRIQMLHTWGSAHNIGRFRLSVTDNEQDFAATLPAFAIYILSTPETLRTERQNAQLATYFQAVAPSLEPLRQDIRRLKQARQDLLAGGPLSIEWLASDPGIVSFGTHPRTGQVLAADWTEGKIKVLLAEDDPSGEPLPESLADTGVFQSLDTLTPNPGVTPYEINTPFWSDHAVKSRWVLLFQTNGLFGFDQDGPWQLPTGSAWVKHFEMEMVRGDPNSRKRLETRFLIRNDDGVHGLTYKWNEEQTDAILVPPEGLDESLIITVDGEPRAQVWRYPSRGECLQCHTSAGGLALGFNTGQLNRMIHVDDGWTNQVQWLESLGYFEEPVPADPAWPEWSEAKDENTSLERRVRSYLAANCAQCHQPGGLGRGLWDARYAIPLAEAGILNGLPVNDLGNPEHRIVLPGDTERSLLYKRLAELGQEHMPPLATSILNEEAIRLLERWINDETPYAAAGLNVPPSVSLISPTPGAAYRAPVDLSFMVGAADSDDNLRQVDLYLDDEWFHAWTNAPFALTLTNMALGAHRVAAVATDADGATNASAEISFEIKAGAIIESIQHGAGSTFLIGVRGGRNVPAVLEYSKELNWWAPLKTNVLMEGWHEFETSMPNDSAQRFYRIRLEE